MLSKTIKLKYVNKYIHCTLGENLEPLKIYIVHVLTINLMVYCEINLSSVYVVITPALSE